MARDYGTKRSTQHRRSAPHQLLIILVTFLLGYLTATFWDPQTISTWMNTQVLANHEKPQVAAKAEPQRAQVPPKPKFEFYTLLTNEKGATQPAANSNSSANHPTTATVATTTARPSPVTNGTAAVTTAANNSVKPKTPVTNQPAAVKVAVGKPLPPAQGGRGSFLVQVAAFKARQDAEHMKGLLILKGFDVNVVPVTNAHGNWFRVVVGPYANRVLAQKAQITLAKTERLRGMVTPAGG
ncbi:SPOR domain-containing protein [Legionella quateirensis]|uniref:Sporulation domain-containing protein n=1 Tax=Legionella quateirensis TaxID=45072 RepID=A0A378KZJ1_9GAMM|nr:SPOR domain-containing protein [Legionella quateirensis]KTD43740.1 Sporulation domain-containing protein [Legionella quateirensis]STY17270.1 Sporulation domain-containing protein [Legionella quateirensis]